MINLLPPAAKEDKVYAKRNQQLLRYVWTLVFLALVLGVEFGGAEVYLARQRHSYDQQISSKEQQIAGFKQLQDQAKSANARLKAFKQLVGSQARFSILLSDLANHTPQGVFINSITLTGNAKTAVNIAATANSYQTAVSFRDALVTSPRVQDAAIDNITNPAAGVYTVNVTVAFKAGAAQ